MTNAELCPFEAGEDNYELEKNFKFIGMVKQNVGTEIFGHSESKYFG